MNKLNLIQVIKKINKIWAIVLILISFSASSQSAWTEIVKEKKGNVTVHYFDSQFYIHKNNNNQLQGIEYDLLTAFFEFTEKKYGVKINVTYTPSESFGGLYKKIQEGNTGIFGACSFSITPERAKEVRFSASYMPDIELFVSSNNLPVAKDTADFAKLLESATALTIKNTTFEKEMFAIQKEYPDMKIEYKKNYEEIKELLFNDNNYVAYLELPVYFMSLKNGSLFKRQSFYKVERDGYAFIYPLKSDWQEPVNAFFEDKDTKLKIENILKKNLGEDINEFISSLRDEDKKEVSLLAKENEIQQMELEKKQIEVEKNNIVKNVYIFSIVLLMIFLGMIYNISRVRKNANLKLTLQKEEILAQKVIIEGKNKNIVDSINYAKRIQDNILPSDSFFKKLLPDSFVIYNPKDIISGDFYFVGHPILNEQKNIVVFAVGDCTGHGVPGALLSIVGKTFLQLGLTDKGVNSCSESLTYLNKGLLDIVRNEHSIIADGMDIAICAINFENYILEYAGANNPIYICRNNEIIILEASKYGIGQVDANNMPYTFKDISFQLQKNDTIYMFSDGFADQFGGPNNKKFTYKRLREKLVAISNEPMAMQKAALEIEFDKWKGNNEQTDDVCLVGVKV